MQLHDINEPLSNSLYNFFLRIFPNIPSENYRSFEDYLNEILRKKFGTINFIDFETDLYGERYWVFRKSLFDSEFNKLLWHEKYTLIECLKSYLDKKHHDGFLGILNNILERENSGYRMNSNFEFIPITSNEEIQEVNQTQSCGIDTVMLHMNKAVSLFADRDNPDYHNSIKEAISALEALGRKITGDDKIILSQAIKQMDIHPALRDAIGKLYAYSGDEEGIRHALKTNEVTIDFNTAKFIIVTSSAIINFLISFHNKE